MVCVWLFVGVVLVWFWWQTLSGGLCSCSVCSGAVFRFVFVLVLDHGCFTINPPSTHFRIVRRRKDRGGCGCSCRWLWWALVVCCFVCLVCVFLVLVLQRLGVVADLDLFAVVVS